MKSYQMVFGLLFLVIVLSSVLWGGLPLGYYFDAPSALIVFFGGFFASIFSHGFGGIIEAYRTAIRGGDEIDEQILIRSRAVFVGLHRNFMFLGLFGIVIGSISLLGFFSNINEGGLASGTATMLISLFYGFIGSLLLVFPFLSRIESMMPKAG
jgi:flagellar motor component MotA